MVEREEDGMLRSIGWTSVSAGAVFSIWSVFLPTMSSRLNLMAVGAALFMLGDIVLLIISTREG